MENWRVNFGPEERNDLFIIINWIIDVQGRFKANFPYCDLQLIDVCSYQIALLPYYSKFKVIGGVLYDTPPVLDRWIYQQSDCPGILKKKILELYKGDEVFLNTQIIKSIPHKKGKIKVIEKPSKIFTFLHKTFRNYKFIVCSPCFCNSFGDNDHKVWATEFNELYTVNKEYLGMARDCGMDFYNISWKTLIKKINKMNLPVGLTLRVWCYEKDITHYPRKALIKII